MSNIELRPGAKRWINDVLGWEATSEMEEVLDEEDIEEVDSLAEEVAINDWDVGPHSKEELEHARKAHRAKMMHLGGEKLRAKCRMQQKYVKKAAEADFAPMARSYKELAADLRTDIRTEVKKLLAHSKRARKLKRWIGALDSTQVEAGQADDIDLQEMASDAKETLTDPAHDEFSPEMEEAQMAVEMQLEEDGADQA